MREKPIILTKIQGEDQKKGLHFPSASNPSKLMLQTKNTRNFGKSDGQWWILGEVNEAVASGPLKNTAYNLILLYTFFYRSP